MRCTTVREGILPGKFSRAITGRCRLGFILLVIAVICYAEALRHSAQADELQSGIAAYDRGDYARALKIFTPLAKRCDKYAESHFGAIAHAQYKLGQMYWAGLGVPKDYDEAAKWYQRAADRGQAEAQAALADMYLHGQSVPRGTEKAVELYRKAANQGMAFAQYQMGTMHYEGAIVAKDPVQAYLWFSLALTGLKPGAFRDDATKALHHLARQMSSDQLSEAERLVDAWVPLSELAETLWPPRIPPDLTFEDLKADAGEDCAESEGRDTCACEWARRATKMPCIPIESWCELLKERDFQ